MLTVCGPTGSGKTTTLYNALRDIDRTNKNVVTIEDPVAYIRAFGAKMPDSRPSMAQDHAAGKRTEIDAINGAIPREAAEFRLSVPTNTFVTRVIRARESVL